MIKPLVKSLLIFALTASTSSMAAAPEPIILKPTSAWQVNYADERCRLGRQFGEGEQMVLLFMDRFAPGEDFRLTIAGKPAKTIVEKGEAAVQFGPGEQEQRIAFVNGTLGEESALVFSSSARIAPPSEAELMAIKKSTKKEPIEAQPISENREKAVKYLRVGKPLRKPVILETGSMRGPLAALDTCIDNLLTSWGVDAVKHKTLSQPVMPKNAPNDWIKWFEYPRKMLFVGQPALVSFRLSIGPDGVPTACYIQATTRLKEFDDAVCKSVMKRARFSPALDAQGQPFASFYQNDVYFKPS